MKTINYDKTNGTFKIHYLNDNETFEESINIDESSIKTDLKKFIIDNEIEDIFSFKTKVGGNWNERQNWLSIL